MHAAFDVPLAPHTTMRVGGPAQRMVHVSTIHEAVDVAREVTEADEPLLVLSGGSNLLVADAGFAGTVVRMGITGIEELERSDGRVRVRVGAGENWDDFVAHSVSSGWSGLEALSGIPGLVGATPIQNVGAYGQDVSQTISAVRVYDRHRDVVSELTSDDCQFTYRHSMLKGTDRYVVLDVVFHLYLSAQSQPIAYADLARGLGVEAKDTVPLPAAREAVLEQRRRRGMVLDPADHDTWSCGSFFTNPIVNVADWDLVLRQAESLGIASDAVPCYPAGAGSVKASAAWLIQHAGFAKGFSLNNRASLSTKHTLALTNRGDASAADIATLARHIRDGVHTAFGIELVPEPVWVGHTMGDAAPAS